MHTPQGLASFPQILTEEDVVRFNAEFSPAAEPSIVPEPVADPESVAEVPPPAPAPAEEPAPAPSAEEPAPPSDEEMAASLERDNTKADLLAMAEAAGIDQSGNEAELSARLVEHYRSQK